MENRSSTEIDWDGLLCGTADSEPLSPGEAAQLIFVRDLLRLVSSFVELSEFLKGTE